MYILKKLHQCNSMSFVSSTYLCDNNFQNFFHFLSPALVPGSSLHICFQDYLKILGMAMMLKVAIPERRTNEDAQCKMYTPRISPSDMKFRKCVLFLTYCFWVVCSWYLTPNVSTLCTVWNFFLGDKLFFVWNQGFSLFLYLM